MAPRNYVLGLLKRRLTGEPMTLELAISEEEARRGTPVELGLPVFERCIRCLGRGCTRCDGQGVIEGERSVKIAIPPLWGSGTTFVLSLTDLRVHNSYVRVRVRVEPDR